MLKTLEQVLMPWQFETPLLIITGIWTWGPGL